ncbi:pilin [Salarchaeum sp. III]|uniref:pilin n=1 Tax=Salarchaeum sp. III TaxID=3107927 RepID=UPI003FA78C63
MNDSPSDPASDASATESPSTDDQPTESSVSSRLKPTLTRVSPRVVSLAMGLAFLVVAVGPAAAQNQVGDVYCNTGVATGIDLVFGAVAGLGLPATGFYTGKAGLSYMRAGGNPERKNEAKEKLVMSGIGFGIVVLALVSPELIDKVGSQMGFGFSDCVKPF